MRPAMRSRRRRRAAARRGLRAPGHPRSASSSGAGAAGRRASTVAAAGSPAPGTRRRGARRPPRQRGIVSTARGRSSRPTTRAATSSARSRVPENEGAASGSSSLSWSIGVQIPSGQTAEIQIPLRARAPQVGERAEAERDRAVLGRRVERLARGCAEARERDHVDHVAAAGGPHQLERGERAVDRAQRVDLEQRPAQLLVVLPDVAGDQHAGVVDPDVERARPLARLRAAIARQASASRTSSCEPHAEPPISRRRGLRGPARRRR